MTLIYFDSSALVKLVVEESGSDTVASLWDSCDAALSSRLAYPEVCAALAAAERTHDLDEDGCRSATSDWEEFWAAMRPVELTAEVEREAGRLAALRALRGADAVHLASILAVDTPDLVVAVWDRRLHAGVVAEQVAVTPPRFND